MAKNANADNGSEKSKPASKINTILIVVLIIVVVALIAVVVYFFRNPRTESVPQTTAPREVLITPENVSQKVAQLQTRNSDASYTTSMSIDWNFKDGASASTDAYVENDVSNSRSVYFDVLLSPDNDTIYSSPIIPVGSMLKDIRLDRELQKGDYKAIVVYHLVDDDNKDISTVSVAINLHILN